MDPLFLSLAWAIATGMGNVATILIEEGIVRAAVEPIAQRLRQRVQEHYHTLEKNEALARQIQAAIEDAARQKGETLALQYARRLNLHRLVEPGNESLRDEVMRLVYLASADDFPHDISDSLLTALHLASSERLPLARFLFFLRRHLNTLPDFRLLLEAGHQQNVERALRHMKFDISSLATTVTDTKQGPAVRTMLVEREWDAAPYLRYLTNICNLLPLGVIDPQYASPTSENAIRLNDIYIDLEGVSDYGRRKSLLGAISSNGASKHVILGAPGGGKSTLVNYLAYSLAFDQLQPGSKWLERSSKWELGAMLPVRVILREWVAWLEEHESRALNAHALWDYIEYNLASHGFGSSFEPLRKQLLEHGGVILLDGLDEVPNATEQRETIKSVIEDFAHAAALCRIIVTCRPYAYEKLEWKLSGFSEISIAPFNSEQIEGFVRGWYYAVVRATGMNSALAEAKADSLITACQLPFLTPLAEQPLLLTLMATLHTSRGNLPDDRADLYEDCVKLMLDYWQQSKRVRVDGQIESEKGILDALGISRDRLEQALNHIAYVAHERQGKMRRRQYGTADISGEELRKTLAPILDDSLDKANTIVHYVRTRSGLLLERDPDTFAFPHRTFQEFLAARYLLNSEDFPSNLAEWARSDRTWWHEVYLLAAGHARPYAFGQAIALINELCNTDYHPERPISGEDAYAAILAAHAAIEVRLRERALTPRYHATLGKLQDWLIGIVEQGVLTGKERAEAGRFLSVLGDVRQDVACAIPTLIDIAGGEFKMGEDDKQHRVALGEYSIGKYPVTNGQYRRFIDDGGYTEKHKNLWTLAGWDYREKNKIEKPKWWDSPQWNYDNHPVVGVSWYEAIAYCNWLTRTNSEGSRFRLPTEAEWEKVAGGDDGRKWPWGSNSEDEKANTRECGIGQATAVGLFPQGAGIHGVLDMAGNVAEWCSSAHAEYPYAADDGRECLEGTVERCVRGGSWRYGLSLARCTYRLGFRPDDRSDYVGLRVAASR